MPTAHQEGKLETGHLSKLELLPKIVGAAVNFVTRFGSEQACEGMAGPMRFGTAERMEIAYRTPQSMTHGESNYGVDVWYDRKKVFSACWNSSTLKDYEIVRFNRGPWIPYLLGLAA